MKTNRLSKVLLSLLAISSPVIFSNNAHADEYSYNMDIIKDEGHIGKSNTVSPIITNELRTLSHGLTLKAWLNGEIRADQMATDLNPVITSEEGVVSVNNDMQINPGETLAAHEAILENLSGVDQTLHTASFEYSQNNAVTTKTSHTTGFDVTSSAEMSFPLASGSLSMTVKYEFNHTNEVSTSVTHTWTVPSQPILVPSGRKYSVNWVLNQGIATGTVQLQSNVQGFIPYRINGIHPVGTAFREDDRLSNELSNQGISFPIFHPRSEWNIINDSMVSRDVAPSTYRAQYGTQLIMTVNDVTEPRNPVTVMSTPLNIIPARVES